MLKARKLGPQSYKDFLKDELPTESTAITKKDQIYWNSKNQFFQKIIFDNSEPPQQNIDKIKKAKYESELRLKKNSLRRTMIQFKSNQKDFTKCKLKISEELLNNTVIQQQPIHLLNNVDNLWNHLEKLDEKHLKLIYGPKSFERQKRAISMIDANFEADIELQSMKEQIKYQRKQRILKQNNDQSFTLKTKFYDVNQLRKIKQEYNNLILNNITQQDEYWNPILFQYVQKHAISLKQYDNSINDKQQEKSIRSKSFNTCNQNTLTQISEGDEIKYNKVTEQDFQESLNRFEITYKNRCQYL